MKKSRRIGLLLSMTVLPAPIAQALPEPVPAEGQSPGLQAMARRGLQGAAAGAITGCITPIVISGGISALGGPLAELYGLPVGASLCPSWGMTGAIIGAIGGAVYEGVSLSVTDETQKAENPDLDSPRKEDPRTKASLANPGR